MGGFNQSMVVAALLEQVPKTVKVLFSYFALKTLAYANKENSSKILLSFVMPNDEHIRPILVAEEPHLEAVRPQEGGGDVVGVHLLLLVAAGLE